MWKTRWPPCAVELQARRLDLLFVNAGVAINPDAAIGAVSTEDFVRMMVTNALSPMRLIESFESLVPPPAPSPRCLPDWAASGDNVDGGWEGYRASKAALNTLMRSFAARQPADPRSLLLIAPGWVRTDMGGPEAVAGRSSESIPRVVDVVSAQAGRTGLSYLDYPGRTVPW